MQIHRVHPVQRPDHGHRFSGAGAHAVPDRPGPGPCAGQGRGAGAGRHHGAQLSGLQQQRILLRCRPYVRHQHPSGCRYRRHRRDVRQERYLGGAGAGGRHRHPGRAFGCAARHPGGDGHPVLCGQRGRIHPAGVRAAGHPETAGVRRLHPHGAHRERRHRGRRGLCAGGKSACHGAAVLPGCV